MRKYLTAAAVLITAVSFISCDLLLDTIADNKNTVINPVSIGNVKIGQFNKYRLVEIQDYASDNPSCIEKGDTLVLKVITYDDTSITFEESLTPGSVSILNPIEQGVSINGIYEPDVPSIYKMIINSDSLYLAAVQGGDRWINSRLTFQYGKGLPVKITGDTATYNDCTLEHNTPSYKAVVPNFHLNGMSFQNVMAVVDDIDIPYDGPGFTFIYNVDKEGIIKSYMIGAWASSSNCWEMIRF